MENPKSALILGAGAQGLACAVRLWEQGWDVTVMAEQWNNRVTSSGAGAIWEFPPWMCEPKENSARWTLDTLEPLMRLSALSDSDFLKTGARMQRSYYVYVKDEITAREKFAALLALPPHYLSILQPQWGLPPPGLLTEASDWGDGVTAYAACVSHLAPVVCMSRYMPWLTRAVSSLPHVTMCQATVKSVMDVLSRKREVGASIVVNCLGLGSREVFQDSNMLGTKGRLVYALCPGLSQRFSLAFVSIEDDPGGLTYMIPQVDGVVAMAGTAEPEATAETHAAEEEEGIVRRCTRAFACLRDKPLVVVGSWMGIRPRRKGGIRLEIERLNNDIIIHNYGHGGSGVIMSWGTATEVASLAEEVGPKALLKRRVLPPQLAALSSSRPAKL